MRDLIGSPRLRIGLAGAGVLLVASLVAAPLLIAHHGAATRLSKAPNPTAEPSPTFSGPATLVAGNRQVNGVQLGFPHTTIGAISAASDYLGALASTLDPDYAATLGRTIADPANSSLPTDLASSTTKLRAALQLPISGPLQTPVAFLTTPEMYQLPTSGADAVIVLLLTANTFTNATGGLAQTTGVFPMRMHWADGDWRLAGIGDDRQDYSTLSASPGTADATNKGWQTLLSTTAGTP